MIRLTAVAIAVAAALGGSPSFARSVDYSGGEAALEAAAQELKIAPLTPPPAPGARPLALIVGPAADHETLALGMYCSAYKVSNPIRLLMPILMTGSPDPTAATLRITTARSYRRCVEVGEMNTRCITKVSIGGTVSLNGQEAPVSGEAERDASVGGFCAKLAKGIGVVSREAALALIADAQIKLDALSH